MNLITIPLLKFSFLQFLRICVMNEQRTHNKQLIFSTMEHLSYVFHVFQFSHLQINNDFHKSLLNKDSTIFVIILNLLTWIYTIMEPFVHKKFLLTSGSFSTPPEHILISHINVSIRKLSSSEGTIGKPILRIRYWACATLNQHVFPDKTCW